jgi:hypothetical protein
LSGAGELSPVGEIVNHCVIPYVPEPKPDFEGMKRIIEGDDRDL